MSRLEPVGDVGGHTVYADTGTDEQSIILKHIRERINSKRLKPGDRFMMPVSFGQDLIVEITVHSMEEYEKD